MAGTRLQLVLAVLAHELTVAEAARRRFADLEVLREAAQLPVARFATRAGIPERTCHRRFATLRAGDEPGKGARADARG